MDQGPEIPVEQKYEELSPGYLECIDPNCQYYGLVKVPINVQKPWSEEMIQMAGLQRMVTAECPGCGSSRVVKLAEEIAPDVTDPEKVRQWLEQYVVEPSISYSHLPPDQQRAKTIEQAEIFVKDGLDGDSPHNVKEVLVEYVSRDYPTEK